MYDCICVGSATQDVFVQADWASLVTLRQLHDQKNYLAFEYGGKINVGEIHFASGGSATNTSCAMARQGLKTAALTIVGQDDAGQSILKELETYGVDTALVVRSPDRRTAYSVILVSWEGDRTVLTHRGASHHLAADMVNWEMLGKTKWLYLSSLTGASESLYEPLFATAAAQGVKVAFNPGQAQIEDGLAYNVRFLRHTAVLFLNREEAARLTGLPPVADAVDDMMVLLHHKGAQVVVVTEGHVGVQAYDGRTRYFYPAFPVEVASTLGAGDAFAATLIAGLIRHGGDLYGAIPEAAANAAAVCRQTGAKAGLLDLEGIKQLLAEYRAGRPEVLGIRLDYLIRDGNTLVMKRPKE